LRSNSALVVGPGKNQFAAFRSHGMEHEVGIGGHRGMKFRAKDLPAVLAAGEDSTMWRGIWRPVLSWRNPDSIRCNLG